MATKKSQVLSDRFLVGEELGRGAYGQVYKGIDYKTGDTVAIKQISLAGIPTDNLQSVMGEIELLKTLNHKNIVKYIGSFKTRTHLYIILEYMENGSLASIIKPNKFGTFPESLVAVYIAQVLQGLQYLHDQVGGGAAGSCTLLLQQRRAGTACGMGAELHGTVPGRQRLEAPTVLVAMNTPQLVSYDNWHGGYHSYLDAHCSALHFTLAYVVQLGLPGALQPSVS